MWIVKLALRRPYTFVVIAMMIAIVGALAIVKTPKDIFPSINEPIVTVIWQYPGFPAPDMANQITEFSEYTITQFVNDVKRIESQSVFGKSVIRIYFQPTVSVDRAVAQVTATSQTILKRMPVGTTPPWIMSYDPSSVPIMQIALGSQSMSEAELFDFAQYTLRQALAPVQGALLPSPYGGNPRTIMVDLDPAKLQSQGITPSEVNQILNAQNVILPTGSVFIGDTEYMLRLNNTPPQVSMLNDLPIKTVNGAVVYMRDVASVRDGYMPQTNLVRYDGHKSALVSVLKTGKTSTLDVIGAAKAVLDNIPLPKDLKLSVLFDQSVFVVGAMRGVVIEGLIAAGLTGLLILLFLGSWRSTLVVAVSIPVSVLAAIFMLSSLGHTLNLMTLGGLALSVGILVDNGTVTVENIHRHMAMGKNLIESILDGSREIAIPAFVATLCICIVFLPVGLLTGASKYLFIPMALAVVFAVSISYAVSRTLVPVMTHYLFRGDAHHEEEHAANGARPGTFTRLYLAFDRGFQAFRERYVGWLHWSLQHSWTVIGVFVAAVISAAVLIPLVGRDFFPVVDAGQIRLHVATPTGTRIEQTGVYFSRVEEAMKGVIGDDLGVIVDNIGLPPGTNLATSDNVTTSSADGEILLALKKEHKRGTQDYIHELREKLPLQFPDLTFYFQPADMMNQILNFGLPAPIDVKIYGLAKDEDLYALAKRIESRMHAVPGAVDVHIQQRIDQPSLQINVDRSRAAELGMMQRQVADNLLISASSSLMVSPNYWTEPRSGRNYSVVIQTPPHRLDTVQDLANSPLPGAGQSQVQYLGNVANIDRSGVAALVTHTNVQDTFDVMANVQQRDTGSVASDVHKIVQDVSASLPKGTAIEISGQAETMDEAFLRLGFGLIGATLLVYFIMVINFQSWTDPLIIIMALPGAFCGIIWILFATRTTFNVPSLMGSIMTVGVATANSILVIAFANDALKEGKSAVEAALAAGFARLRPVLMTAFAMIVGMVPMSLGLGEGGEQNAPLGRAVIGGLVFATVATLILVPVIFSLLRSTWQPKPAEEGAELLAAS